MTEKRFYIDTIDGGGSVLTVNGVELGLYETCDLLNELYEEKEFWKSQSQDWAELITFIQNEIEEEGCMTKERLKDLIE